MDYIYKYYVHVIMVNMMRVLPAHHTLDVGNKINVNMIKVHKITKLWVDNNEGIAVDLWY